MFSAKRLDVLCLINKENVSLPLLNMKRLRGKILSVLWQEIVRRTAIMCRCKIGSNSKKKQMRECLKDRGNWISIFAGSKPSSFKINEKFGNGSNIRSMDAR